MPWPIAPTDEIYGCLNPLVSESPSNSWVSESPCSGRRIYGIYGCLNPSESLMSWGTPEESTNQSWGQLIALGLQSLKETRPV